MKESELLLSVFVAVEGAHAFSAFMPSYFTVRKFASDSKDLADLRSGYTPAVIFNVALGGTVAYLIESVAPLILAFIVSVFMIMLYENAIQQKGIA